MCHDKETEAADQTYFLAHFQYTDKMQTSPGTKPARTPHACYIYDGRPPPPTLQF